MKLYIEKLQNILNTSKEALLIIVLLFCAFVAYALGSMFSSATVDETLIVSIPDGYSVSQTAEELEDQGVIRSASAYKLFNRIHPLDVKSGSYEFQEGSHGLQEVRMRLARADYGDIYIAVTIPEGSSRSEIAEILERSELDIDPLEFMIHSSGKEGYLFPDTYLFLPDDDIDEVLRQMEENFQKRTMELQENPGSRSFEDLVTMASIIEKEATGDLEEMRTVSGILWKRIDRGIALQVDAPFLFVSGKTSAQLTTSDLRTDGPYNTYTNRGLTPTPIGNPGIDALEAAANPLESPYLFYLHGSDGIIRYGVTHDDHVANKNTYLR